MLAFLKSCYNLAARVRLGGFLHSPFATRATGRVSRKLRSSSKPDVGVTGNLDPGDPPAWRTDEHSGTYVFDPLRVAAAMEWMILQEWRNPSHDLRLRLADIMVIQPIDGSPIMLLGLAACDVGL